MGFVLSDLHQKRAGREIFQRSTEKNVGVPFPMFTYNGTGILRLRRPNKDVCFP